MFYAKEWKGSITALQLLHTKCSYIYLHVPTYSCHVVDDFGFMSIGIDHAGPVFVKNSNGSDGTMYKAYVTVITCTVTRAIHLEFSPNLNADSLLIPALVVSDNGETFKDRKVKAFFFLGQNRMEI